MSRFSQDSPGRLCPGVPVSQPKSPGFVFSQQEWIVCDLISVQKQNVKALICKSINTGFSCCDFYEKIKSNKDFKKILSTEKHYWANK